MASSHFPGSGGILTMEDTVLSDLQRHPLEINTHVYNINTLNDLENLPEWVIHSIGTQIYNFDMMEENEIFKAQLENFSDGVFGTDLIDSKELSILREEVVKSAEFMDFFDKSSTMDILNQMLESEPSNDKYLDSVGGFISLNQEQRNYLFEVGEGEKYPDMKNRIRLLSNRNDYRQKKDCDVWLIITTINNQPYGAVFAFKSMDEQDKNLMIQGISKFMVPGIFSLLQPKYNKLLPRLNSILIPEVENLAKYLRMDRIVVDPIGKQGNILEKYYGFHQIDAIEYPCEAIFKQIGLNKTRKHLAKDV